MKRLTVFCLAVSAVCAWTALVGAGTASATKIYKNTTPNGPDALGVGTVIVARMTPGSTATFTTTDEKTLVDTCTSMQGEGTIEKDGGAPSGKATVFTFGGCSHKVTSLSLGELEVKHISGTTNGTIISRNTEATVLSTTFGVSCIANTAGGTAMGTVTGAAPGNPAVLHINAIIPTGFLCGGDTRLKGAGEVIEPTGLVVEAS